MTLSDPEFDIEVVKDPSWDATAIAEWNRQKVRKVLEALRADGALTREPEAARRFTVVETVAQPSVVVHEVRNPGESWLWFDRSALYVADERLLLISRPLEGIARWYMIAFALLDHRSGLSGLGIMDAAAWWYAGEVSPLAYDPKMGGRGRLLPNLMTILRDGGGETFGEVFTWCRSDLRALDDSLQPPRPPSRLEIALSGRPAPIADPLTTRRAMAWFIVYAMHTYAVDAEGRFDYEGKPLYEDLWRQILADPKRLESAGNDAFPPADVLDRYYQFVRRKVNYNQSSDGRLIPWQKYRSPKGEVTGRPEDDLIR